MERGASNLNLKPPAMVEVQVGGGCFHVSGCGPGATSLPDTPKLSTGTGNGNLNRNDGTLPAALQVTVLTSNWAPLQPPTVPVSTLDPYRCHAARNISSPSQCHQQIPCTSTTDHKDLELVARPEKAYLSPHKCLASLSPFSHSSTTLNECCAPSSATRPRKHWKMGLSKSQRIIILLGIDSCFFLIELIVGELPPGPLQTWSRD